MNLDISKQKAVLLLRFLYPLWAIIGILSLQFIPSMLIVSGNAIATANNIIANELLFRAGIIGSLFTQLIHIFVVLILYKLFKAVDKNQSMLIVVLGLIGVPIAMLNTLNKVAALLLTNNPEQLMFFLNLNKQGIFIAALFWGLWLLPQGVLIYKSGYFPKIFSFFMLIAGSAYFIGSIINLLLPNLTTIILVLDILTFGEVIFMVWVMFKGATLPEIEK